MGSCKCQVIIYIYIYIFLLNSAQYCNLRPQNKEELFNLRHSSARNAIERIFGVLKRRFRILLLAPEYSLEIQARIPAALSNLHNFISIHNPHDQPISNTASNAVQMYDEDDGDIPVVGAQDDVDLCWDRIAQDMWDDYLRVCEERGIGRESDDGIRSDLEEDSDKSEESSGSSDLDEPMTE